MIHYVMGFAFNLDKTKVAMIFKNRGPEEVRGKWNGLGGHVERNESPLMAMQREFKEEGGVWIEKWDLVSVYWSKGRDFRINFYMAVDEMKGLKTNEDEAVALLPGDTIIIDKHVNQNIRWLIPLSLDPSITKPVTVHESPEIWQKELRAKVRQELKDAGFK